ncbi:MAG: amidase [Nitrospirae bacterium]|nr:amidase [Nitrospirota bacterium]
MAYPNLSEITLLEASIAIKGKQLSPIELVSACLARIEKLNPILNAYITVAHDEALSSARSATEEIAQGNALKPLHGIPMGIKDVFDVAGMPTTAGSSHTTFPSIDSTIARKLKDAGAILLGKHNMHEWACGATNRESHFGPVHNPWNVDCISGGSSGGSAAAVAAGLDLGSIGSDTAGSIRIPAALCGVVGLKPTFGSVSRNGMVPLSWSLDHVGTIARTVDDVETLFKIIAQKPTNIVESNEISASIVQADGIRCSDNLVGLRVGIPKTYFFDGLDKEVQNALHKAIEDITNFGAIVDEVSLPDVAEAVNAHAIIMYSDAAAYHEESLASNALIFSDTVIGRLRRGQEYKATEYSKAKQIQSSWTKCLEHLFQKIDVLITPTTAVPAPHIIKVPNSENRPLILLTCLFNLTGNPAISLPCGFTSLGLPIGMQLVAKKWYESTLVATARFYEQSHPWSKQRPGIPS